MKQYLVPFAALALLTACEPVTPPPADPLPLLAGYRDPADQCVRVGENAYTNQFLDHTSDLVGCPVGYEGIGVFVTETGAVQVGQSQGYILYTVSTG